MSGADYAHCGHCGTKAFYDADTEIGDATIFHGKCLPKHDAAVAARAWDEGHTAGVRNASAEFDGPVQDNPYKREGGAS